MADLPDPSFCYDCEVYSSFCMVGFINCIDGSVIQFTSEPGIGLPLADFEEWWDKNCDAMFFSFNGIGYDNHIVRAMLKGKTQLYDLSKSIIEGKDKKSAYKIEREINCDLYVMNGGGAFSKIKRIGSLKECGIKLNHWRLQELPYRFDTDLTHEQMVNVAEYNVNDLAITYQLALNQSVAVNARLDLMNEYGVDCINSTNAKISELMMGHMLFGSRKPSRPAAKEWFIPGSELVKGFEFHDPMLKEILDKVSKWNINYTLVTNTTADGEKEKLLEKTTREETFFLDGVEYNLKMGGLHSVDKPGTWEADDNFRIIDFDAASFYPALMINERLIPSHLDPDKFIAAYETLRSRRLEAKSQGLKALSDGLKISLNSVFGKYLSAYSWLSDPSAGLKVTVRGQLTLLQFIELAISCGGQIVSANTDGILVRIKRDDAETLISAMDEMASLLGFVLEQTEYRKIFRSAGNAYIAVGEDGYVKAKGHYNYDKNDMGKQSTIQIVVDAARAYFVHGTPVEDTVRKCLDITKFIDYFKCNKGWKLVNDGGEIGKIARWYIGTKPNKLLKMSEDGSKTIVTDSWQGAVIINDLPELFPQDINYEIYQRMAERLIDMIDNPEIERQRDTIEQKDLTRAQRDANTYNRETTVPDVAKCGALDLDNPQKAYDGQARGNAYDSMRAVLMGLWFRESGKLTKGDLIHLMDSLDEAAGYFQRADKRKSILSAINWICGLSPFRKPVTINSMVKHAQQWAIENKSPGVSRVLVPKVSRDKFLAGGELYSFICAVAMANVKSKLPMEDEHLVKLIEQEIAAKTAEDQRRITVAEKIMKQAEENIWSYQ